MRSLRTYKLSYKIYASFYRTLKVLGFKLLGKISTIENYRKIDLRRDFSLKAADNMSCELRFFVLEYSGSQNFK